MIKTLMRMTHFGFVMVVNMMAMFFGKLLFQMAHSIKRLE